MATPKYGTVAKDVCMEEMSKYWQTDKFSKKLSASRFSKHQDVPVNEVMTKIGSLRIPKQYNKQKTDVICNPNSQVQPLKLVMKEGHFGLQPVLTAPNSDFDTLTYHQKECIPAARQVQTNEKSNAHTEIFKVKTVGEGEYTLRLFGSFPKCSDTFEKINSYKDQIQEWFANKINVKVDDVEVTFYQVSKVITMSIYVKYATKSAAIYGNRKLADRQLEVSLRCFLRDIIRDTLFFRVERVEGAPSKGEFSHTRCATANKFAATNIFLPLTEENPNDDKFARSLRKRPTQILTELYGPKQTKRPIRKAGKPEEGKKKRTFYRRMFDGKSYRETNLMREPTDPEVYEEFPNAFKGVSVSANEYYTGNICPPKGTTMDETRVQLAESLAPVLMQEIDKKKWIIQQGGVAIPQDDIIDGRLKDRKGITGAYPKRLNAATTQKFASTAPFAKYMKSN